ncbi:MAG: Crp/Fnr family transcriptional regulator, partial [Bacteroidales bacterium]
KGETLFDEKQLDNKLFYITKGSCVRFIVTPQGNERAIMFHTESFIPVIGNMYLNSDNSWVSYSLKANETTELIEFRSDFGYEWQQKDKVFSLFLLQRSAEFLSTINQLQNHLIGLDSETFYQWLIEKYPFILQRFMSKDIASFMGVTPVWLSNIKRKILEK